jgi:hypothetical protein
VSSDYSSQPPYNPYRYDRPPSNNNAVVWIVFGALFGSFALCGVCGVVGLTAVSFLGQSRTKTFSNVASAIQAAGPVDVAATPQTAATAFVTHLSNGASVEAFDLLSNKRQAVLTPTEFKEQLDAWPKEEDTAGPVRVAPGSGPIGKQNFVATATDEKGKTHRLELELVFELGQWKVDGFKLK